MKNKNEKNQIQREVKKLNILLSSSNSIFILSFSVKESNFFQKEVVIKITKIGKMLNNIIFIKSIIHHQIGSLLKEKYKKLSINKCAIKKLNNLKGVKNTFFHPKFT